MHTPRGAGRTTARYRPTAARLPPPVPVEATGRRLRPGFHRHAVAPRTLPAAPSRRFYPSDLSWTAHGAADGRPLWHVPKGNPW